MNELFRKAWQEAIEELTADINKRIHDMEPITGDLHKNLNDEPKGVIVEGSITPVDSPALPEPKTGPSSTIV